LSVTVTWLGHSCFKLCYDGFSVVIDPYDNTCNYPPLNTKANAVYCSHFHHDHCYTQAVTIAENKNNPFNVTKVLCAHDQNGGRERGENIIHIFEADGIRIAHFGDLGHMLSEEQITLLGHCDCVLIPIGSVYTIDALFAFELFKKLDADIFIPMHYKTDKFGFDVIDGIDSLLSVWNISPVNKIEFNSIQINKNNKKQLAILQFEPERKR